VAASKNYQEIARIAIEARHHAYARYSGFKVGAAVACEDGSNFGGCNVENASYGLTICAERVAISNAVAAGHRSFTAIAIATDGGHPPCGACRQFMAEFASDLEILLIDVSRENETRLFQLSDLLPRGFKMKQ
jgi:cytidine deaminase